MNTKHTPSPWTMNDYGEIYGPDGEQILVSGVAVPCGNHSKAEEARANGRLFFAAPLLFEALKEQCQNALELGYCDETCCENCKCRNALRAARGEK